MNDRSQCKRPLGVWIISIFYLLSGSWTLLSFYLVLSGKIPLPPEQNAYFDSLTTVDWTLSVLLCLANIVAAVALFRLRRLAFYLFAGSLALNILLLIWHTISKEWISAVGGPGAIGALVGIAIAAAICQYSWHLLKTGILR